MRNNNIKAGSIAALALVIGTFAWQSFSQMALNESSHMHDYDVKVGARLRDDYDGSNKDVYVENYSDVEDGTLAYARIRLDEYFEYGEGAGTLDAKDVSILRGDIPNAEEPLFGDSTTWDTYAWGSEADDEVESIRTYRNLSFAGKTVYMPTFNKNYNSLESDINGTYAGLDGDRTTDYDRYADYQTYEIGDESEATAVEVADPEDESGYMVQPATVHKAQATLNSKVISMQDWKDAEEPIGNYWVYDDEGWAYWAAPIEPQTATGLLLDEILVTEDYDGEWYYAVNVIAQVASAGDWGDEPEEGVTPGSGMYEYGLSGDGRHLLDQISADDEDPNRPEVLPVVKDITVTKADGTELTDEEKIMNIGDSISLKATAEIENDNGATEVSVLEWAIEEMTMTRSGLGLSEGEISATMNNGTFTPVSHMGGGTYLVTVKSAYTEDVSSEIVFTIREGVVTVQSNSGASNMALSASNYTLKMDSGIQNITGDSVSWTMKEEGTDTGADVSDAISTSGIITATDEMLGGTFRVTATSTVDTTIYGYKDISINDATLTLSGNTTVNIGSSVTVGASVSGAINSGLKWGIANADGNTIELEPSITTDGIFTPVSGMSGGKYTITAQLASNDKVIETRDVTVNVGTVTVSSAGNAASMTLSYTNNTLQMTATANNITAPSSGDEFAWMVVVPEGVTDKSGLTVDEIKETISSNGLFSPRDEMAGSSYSIVATSIADGEKAGSKTISILTPSVTLVKTEDTVEQGDSVEFTATVAGLKSAVVSWELAGVTSPQSGTTISAGNLNTSTGKTIGTLAISATETVNNVLTVKVVADAVGEDITAESSDIITVVEPWVESKIPGYSVEDIEEAEGTNTVITIDDVDFYVLDVDTVTEYNTNGVSQGNHYAALVWTTDILSDLPPEVTDEIMGNYTYAFFDEVCSVWSISDMRSTVLPTWLATKPFLNSAGIRIRVGTDGYYVTDTGSTPSGDQPEITTYDDIFLLSQPEFLEHVGRTDSRARAGDGFWLRSARNYFNPKFVYYAGSDTNYITNISANYELGVRPAMWLPL